MPPDLSDTRAMVRITGLKMKLPLFQLTMAEHLLRTTAHWRSIIKKVYACYKWLKR